MASYMVYKKALVYYFKQTFQPTGFPQTHLYENTKEKYEVQSPDRGVHLYCKKTVITLNKTYQTKGKTPVKGPSPCLLMHDKHKA